MAWGAWNPVWCPRGPPGRAGLGAHWVLTQSHQAAQRNHSSRPQSTPQRPPPKALGTEAAPREQRGLPFSLQSGPLVTGLESPPERCQGKVETAGESHHASKASLRPSSPHCTLLPKHRDLREGLSGPCDGRFAETATGLPPHTHTLCKDAAAVPIKREICFPPPGSGLACDLLWPTGCSGNQVPVPGRGLYQPHCLVSVSDVLASGALGTRPAHGKSYRTPEHPPCPSTPFPCKPAHPEPSPPACPALTVVRHQHPAPTHRSPSASAARARHRHLGQPHCDSATSPHPASHSFVSPFPVSPILPS